MDVWDQFFADPRMVALREGYTIVNRPDGTYYQLRVVNSA